MKFKECKIGKKYYRIVECQTCGKIFNAYKNGKIAGILYSCIEMNCRTPGNGKIESVSKETAKEFIKTELERKKRFHGIEKAQFENLFEEKKEESFSAEE